MLGAQPEVTLARDPVHGDLGLTLRPSGCHRGSLHKGGKGSQLGSMSPAPMSQVGKGDRSKGSWRKILFGYKACWAVARISISQIIVEESGVPERRKLGKTSGTGWRLSTEM